MIKPVGDLRQFRMLGNMVQWLGSITCNYGQGSVYEDIRLACPLAVRANASVAGFISGGYWYGPQIGHPDTPSGELQGQSQAIGYYDQPYQTNDTYTSMDFNLEFCRYRAFTNSPIYANSYKYAMGC